MVGFGNEMQQLKDGLSKHTPQVDVIIVTGAGGVGKTTLAAKIFHDSEIRGKFDMLPLWVHVSECTTKNIFLAILSLLDELPKEASQKTASALSTLVARCFKGRTFFIVIDGVSQIQDPTTLLSAFRGSHMNSKVLITTASSEVARLVGLHSHSTEVPVQPLNAEESFDLLKRLVFPLKTELPSDFVKDGRDIADACRGLPHAIGEVAKILANKMSQYFDPEERIRIWGYVCRSMNTFFTTMPGNPTVLSIYDTLDYHLRACFLYMGIFREQYKFSVSELTRMWIAEGFVPPPDALNPSMERTAQSYLEQLIQRNLVIVHQKKPDGTSPKLCSLNYLMYDFCKTVAGYENENFLQEVKESATNPGDFKVDQVREYRRVCMHSDISKFIEKLADFQNSKVRFTFHLRSFVSHYSEMCAVKKDSFSVICAALKLIRVLDAKPMGFTKIPSDLYRLVHLRYVTLSLSGSVLPADICKLRKIQTLVVHTTSPSLKIEADVSKMTELLHLKTNKPATLAKASMPYSEQLQICGLSPKSCTESFFKRASNLKKLGIRGQLALLLDGTTTSGLLEKLFSVEKLKLVNDVAAVSASKANKPCCLSQRSQFPPSLRSLTLSATRLPWNQIAVLGSVNINLEELKLKDNAFVGEKWEVSGSNSTFPHLKVLHIQGADFKEWKFSTNNFLRLSTLQLSSCMNLTEIPPEFSGINHKLNQLHLSKCSEATADSARRIRDEIKQKRGSYLGLHIDE